MNSFGDDRSDVEDHVAAGFVPGGDMRAPDTERALDPEPFDLTNFDPYLAQQEAGIDVPILHPETGASTGIVIKIAGRDSRRHRKALDAALAKRVERRRLASMDVVETRDEDMRVLAHSIISWSTNGEPHLLNRGRRLLYTPENAEAVFREYAFIYEAVRRAMVPRDFFLS